ncbi:hypothetical protein ABPG74_000494 [Tetrahymena malaccensis]
MSSTYNIIHKNEFMVIQAFVNQELQGLWQTSNNNYAIYDMIESIKAAYQFMQSQRKIIGVKIPSIIKLIITQLLFILDSKITPFKILTLFIQLNAVFFSIILGSLKFRQRIKNIKIHTAFNITTKDTYAPILFESKQQKIPFIYQLTPIIKIINPNQKYQNAVPEIRREQIILEINQILVSIKQSIRKLKVKKIKKQIIKTVINGPDVIRALKEILASQNPSFQYQSQFNCIMSLQMFKNQNY